MCHSRFHYSGDFMKTVYLMMSGGVDSSVAAALLKKRGFNVVGVYMKNWHSTNPEFAGVCPWEQDIRDAKAVAARLEIPFKIWNFEKQYHDRVVKYFFNEYRAGRTPNPDVMCNSQIKFNEFYKKAIEEGADYVASGHYTRVRAITKKQETRNKLKEYQLLAGKDTNKDQSYFLWDIDKKVLPKILFPIGELKKSEVRAIAKNLQLPVADKKDSQGICFIGPINVRAYLESELPKIKGDVVTEKGKKIGEHDGVWFYTEGQRKGTSPGGGIPYFVVKKNIKNNKLIVAPRASKQLFARGLIAKNLNWLVEKPNRLLSPTAKIQAVIRYHHPAVPASICTKGNIATVIFKSPQRAVTPGQSVVFYKEDQLLGGGVINKAVI